MYEALMIVAIINAVVVALLAEVFSYTKDKENAEAFARSPHTVTRMRRITFWEFIFRSTAWLAIVGAFAVLLGLQPSFKLFLLCIFSSLVEGLVWFIRRK